ncbi:TRAP transporter small permease [Phytohalomonas tamaricis]|uniref:TRAP transporter small permease n=1 Tax=Phytohalomonas tamaricis TaxID=2081032 RepID=UPI000D0BA5D2|nr:TRAP transporter small permease [Phytohalomonas tamaricis]
MKKTALMWFDRVMRIDEVLGSVALFALFVVALANVVMRYFFSMPLAWAEEVLQLLMMWATFLGASALVRRNEHVLISLLSDKLPPRWARWNERLFNTSVVLICAAIMLFWGIKLLPFSAFRSTPMLNIPFYWVHLAIPVSAAMMIIHSLRRLSTR